MKTKKLFLILFLLSAITHKTSAANTNEINDINVVVGGNTDFAFDLYGKLKGDSNVPKGNLFFSPYSISTALAMTYGGARGETQKQMATALHFTLPGERLHSAFGALQKQLIEDNKSHGYQLLLANALWGQKDKPFLKEFLDLAQNYYGGGLRLLDFVNETEKSRQIINSWVEEKTKDKIKELVPPSGVNKETVLVLTNAIYFKGEWRTKFEKKDTQPADFYISAKDKIKVDMMHVKGDFKCYTDEKMRVLELPYKSNELSMLVFLPNDPNNFKGIENTLTTESINTTLSKIQKTVIDVYFPKFKMTWGTSSLKNTLIDLGMSDAFDVRKAADFAGINGKGGIWISDVFHKAFVEVNEEGTEAAAATAVVMVKGIGIKPVFRADHPFVFIIKDNRSGSILFIGRLMNPVE